MMKSTAITITGEGTGLQEAFAMTESCAVNCGLEKKSLLHLRLLSEELFGMLRGIAGKVEASYWLENDGKHFELHMKSEIKMTPEMRAQFLSASSDGKNAATRGVMGKIRFMIAGALLSIREAAPYAMMNTAAAYSAGWNIVDESSIWSMAYYKKEVQQHCGESPEAKDAWDELEKSIVANLADDVKVKIIGNHVEIVIDKTF